MRNAFAEQIKKLAAENDRIVLLSGDIGNRLFDPYKEKFGNRFFNCGVAEANMTSMAAGMAMSGLLPVTYTIAPFNTSRCYEQIKIDICYHDLPVVIVGVGAGLSYAGLGATHHSFEDIAIMRVLPNMHIMCPCDAVEVRLCLRQALALKKPVYIRLGKKNEPVIHETDPDLKVGKGIVVRKGTSVCLMACGNIMPVALSAADLLGRHGINPQVVSMHTVKPLDTEMLEHVFADFDTVCTIEEHSIVGGFGSAVAEWAVDNSVMPARRFLRFAIQDHFTHRSGSQENARKINRLTSQDIADRVLDSL